MAIHVTWHASVAATWAVKARQTIRLALQRAARSVRDPIASRIKGPFVGAWDGIRVMHGQHLEAVLMDLLRNHYGYLVTNSNNSGGGFHYCDGPNGEFLVVSCIRGWNRKVTTTDKAYKAVMAEAVKTGRKPVLLVFYDYGATHAKSVSSPFPPGVSVITSPATDDVFGAPHLGAFMADHMRTVENIMAEESAEYTN